MADAAGALSQAIGVEGAAVVEAIQTQQLGILKAAGYYPTFKVGPNGFVVSSDDSPTTIKQLSEGEKMTLRFLTRTADEFDPAAGKVVVPDKYALDAAEMLRVSTAIREYNDVIAELATDNNLALVDINSFFNQVVNEGVTIGGRKFTNAYISGNAFSLDGVHLTQAGYALIAKQFIETINAKYGSKLPLPDISNYPTVALPPTE
jgi:VCBS repeat-containing protein